MERQSNMICESSTGRRSPCPMHSNTHRTCARDVRTSEGLFAGLAKYPTIAVTTDLYTDRGNIFRTFVSGSCSSKFIMETLSINISCVSIYLCVLCFFSFSFFYLCVSFSFFLLSATFFSYVCMYFPF